MAKEGSSYQRGPPIVSVAGVSNLCLIDALLSKYYRLSNFIF